MTTAMNRSLAVVTAVSAAGVLAGPAPVQVAGGILLAFALPGLAVTGILFRGRDLSAVERVVLAPALSLAVLILSGLLMYAAGVELDRTAWTAATAGVTLLAVFAGALPALRRASLPPGAARESRTAPDALAGTAARAAMAPAVIATGSTATGRAPAGSNGTGSNGTGPNAAGPNAAGSNAAGSNAAGSKTAGSNGTGSNGTGPNAAGPNAAGSNAAGSTPARPGTTVMTVLRAPDSAAATTVPGDSAASATATDTADPNGPDGPATGSAARAGGSGSSDGNGNGDGDGNGNGDVAPAAMGRHRLLRQVLPLVLAVAVLGGASWLSYSSARDSFETTVTTLSAEPPTDLDEAGLRTVRVSASGLLATQGPYRLAVTGENGRVITERSVPAAGGSWAEALRVPGRQRLTVHLYRAAEATPYRTLLISPQE
jgi:hypothetical protein